MAARVFLAICSTLAAASMAHPACLGEMAEWGVGPTTGAAGGDGSIALVGAGSRLLVTDLSDPSAPVVVASVDAGAQVGGGVSGGDWAALAVAGGMTLVDLSDPSRPRVAGHVPLDGHAAVAAPRLLAVASTAWGRSSLRTVSLLDVSDLDDPRLVGSHVARDRISAVAAAGRTLAVCGDAGTELVDVSDPSDPVVVGTLDTGRCVAAASGDTMFLAGDQLTVVDLADPAAPQVAATLPLPATAVHATVAGKDTLVVAGWDIAAVVDISAPTAPRTVATFEPDESVHVLAGLDGAVLVGDIHRRIQTYGLTDPASPSLEGPLQPSPIALTRGVAFAGDHLLVVDSGGADADRAVLRSFDAGSGALDPSGTLELPERYAFDIAVDGDRAVVTVSCMCDLHIVNMDLVVVDVSDPANLRHVQTVPDFTGYSAGVWGPPGAPPDVDLSGGIAVAAGGMAVTLDEPADVAVSVFGGDVALVGSVAWAATGAGLCGFDVSDPMSPVGLGCVLDGALDEVDAGSGLLVASEPALGPGPGATLHVLDAADPFAPRPVGSMELPGAASELVVGVGRAAVGVLVDVRPHVAIVDLTRPEAPRLVGFAPHGGGHLALGGDLLAISAGGTVTLHDAACAGSPVPVTFSWTPDDPLLGEEVELRAFAGAAPAELTWSFGDGGTASGGVARHAFHRLPPAEITLEAAGPWGSATVRRMLEVRPLTPTLDSASWLVVPAVAHAEGAAGTTWRTDLTVDTGQAAEELAVFLAPTGADNTLRPGRRITLGPGAAVLEDVVGAVAGEVDAAGALYLHGAVYDIAATSRTYTASGGGTAGQGVPVLRLSELDGPPSHLLLLREDEAFRSNIGVVNPSPRPAAVGIELLAPDGVLLGRLERTVPPYGVLQENRVLRQVTSSPVPQARALVVVDDGGEVLPWASVVDNRSGDAVFVTGAPAVYRALWIPVVAHATGVDGRRWRSEVEVCSASPADARFSIELVRGDATTQPVTFDLEDGACVRWPDVVRDVFGARGSGALRITRHQGQVVASSRTYGVDVGEGTHGQLVPAVSLDPGGSPGSGHSILGLAHSADPTKGFRSNLGLVNLEERAVEVHVRFSGDDGDLLLERTVALGPLEHRQLNSPLAVAGAPDVRAGTVGLDHVGAPAADGDLLAYLSVVDNVTGDPVFIPSG